MANEEHEQPADDIGNGASPVYYRIQFREDGSHATASSTLRGLLPGTGVMVHTDHGLEPAKISRVSPLCGCRAGAVATAYRVERPLTREEGEKYQGLPAAEKSAFDICLTLIAKHRLAMNLVRVERFFNGSKMIFYFTADNRVDFRGLVKDLVHEFRTRVEMRQVGVRHETKMLGGVGTCGRELCCSSFIKSFDSVSIKMAKEQDLPLNPAKISGVCNRLLCCLTYEYETYRRQRKNMPKPGKLIRLGEQEYLVKRQNPLQETILVENADGEVRVLSRQQWRSSHLVKKESQERRRRP